MFPPARIVCLTEETVETLLSARRGAAHRRRVRDMPVRPPQVRREKPRVSAFISADFEKIVALEPDLVLTFSDLQADIAAELIRRNIAVHAFNQRDDRGISRHDPHARRAGRREPRRPRRWQCRWKTGSMRCASRRRNCAPRRAFYFEEWDEPDDFRPQMGRGTGRKRRRVEVFRNARGEQDAKDRIVSPKTVVAARAGHHHRLMVRKKFVPRSRGAARLRADPGGARRRTARDQVGADPRSRDRPR
jgi:iron complex transport system substrate-binding protein